MIVITSAMCDSISYRSSFLGPSVVFHLEGFHFHITLLRTSIQCWSIVSLQSFPLRYTEEHVGWFLFLVLLLGFVGMPLVLKFKNEKLRIIISLITSLYHHKLIMNQ